MRQLLLGLSLLSLVGCGNGRAEVTSDDINGFIADDSTFAFFGFAFGDGADLDDDGADDTVSVAVITLTDSPTLCDDLQNIAAFDDPALLGDHQQLNITAGKVLSNSEELAIDDDQTIINDDAALSFVGIEFAVQQGGVTVAEADDGGNGVLNIQRVSGSTLKADFSGTMTFLDGAGNVVEAVTSGEFTAKRCEALDANAFITGLFLGLFL